MRRRIAWLERVCARRGSRSSACRTGEAIARAREINPAIVLLDLDMPGLDGFEVLRRLKEDESLMETPVIVLSGLSGPNDKVTAFDLGAVDYVTKPFDMTELRVRVRAALRLNSLMRMLAQRAQIDGLSGLWNRAYFDERWTEEIERARRHDRALSLAIMDLDHFKGVNDAHGHPAGDAVIQGVARLLKRECRAGDVACRYGGEEFTLIMPDTDPQQAAATCERIRAALEALKWPRHPARRVTLSCGVVGSARGAPMEGSEWLDTADANLYAAKRGGRNRVEVTDITPREPRLREAG
ncbi:MAG: diguanylate cyclase [Phycisphaerales bacterium]